MQDLNEFEWIPKSIGVFHSKMKNRYDAPRQASLEDHKGIISLNPKMNFEQALDDLDGIERIWIIYLFHLNQKNWKPKVNPPRNPDGIKRGVFATRAPYRPNPIGMSCVKVSQIKGLKIWVNECDLLDHTPILDIKPYLPYADSFPEAKIGWLEDMDRHAFQIDWKAVALTEALWLENQGLMSLEAYVRKQLEYQPLSTRHKRIRRLDNDNCYSLGYRTWRITFELDEESKTILITNIYSAYTSNELIQSEDKYNDKKLHVKFNQTFSKIDNIIELRL